MNKMQGNKKTAAVCYCLLASEHSSENVTELLYWCQETFEKTGYQELYQGFAVGRDIPFAVPFQKYPLGFRCVLDETEAETVFLENMVLSYGMFSTFIKSVNKEIDYYLVLLVTDKNLEEQPELTSIINRYMDLKRNFNLQVLSIYTKSHQEGGLQSDGFVDAYGENGIRSILSQMRMDYEK